MSRYLKRRFNPDEDLQDLKRRAAMGDRQARHQLLIELRRRGVPDLNELAKSLLKNLNNVGAWENLLRQAKRSNSVLLAYKNPPYSFIQVDRVYKSRALPDLIILVGKNGFGYEMSFEARFILDIEVAPAASRIGLRSCDSCGEWNARKDEYVCNKCKDKLWPKKSRRNPDEHLRMLERKAVETQDSLDIYTYLREIDRTGLREKLPVGWLGPSTRKKHNVRVHGWVQIGGYIGHMYPELTYSPINHWGRIKRRYGESVMAVTKGPHGPEEFQVTSIYLWKIPSPLWLINLDR